MGRARDWDVDSNEGPPEKLEEVDDEGGCQREDQQHAAALHELLEGGHGRGALLNGREGREREKA